MANNFKESEEYINEICQAFIDPHDDIESIACKHMGSEGISFIKVTNAADNSLYFNASGKDMAGLCLLVSQIVARNCDVPERITDYNQRKEVARLFKTK